VEEAGIKITTYPQMRCCTTLQKVSVELCSFTTQLIEFKVMQRTCSRGMFFLSLSKQVNLPRVWNGTHACFESCTPLVKVCDNCVVQCCDKRSS